MPRGTPEGARRAGALGGGGAKGGAAGGGRARGYGVKTGTKGQASRATPTGTSAPKTVSRSYGVKTGTKTKTTSTPAASVRTTRPSVKNPKLVNPQGSPYRPNTPSSRTAASNAKPTSSKSSAAVSGAKAKVSKMDAESKKAFKMLGAATLAGAAPAGLGAAGLIKKQQSEAGPPPRPWVKGMTANFKGASWRYSGSEWVFVKKNK